MLYKKYHRSYVSQFKKGTKIKLKLDKFIGEILAEPSINDWRDIFIVIVFISDDIFTHELTLVYASGRLRENRRCYTRNVTGTL